MRKAFIVLMIVSFAFISCGKKAVVKKVDDPGVIYVDGMDLMKKKKYDKAIASFSKVRENYPFDPIAVVAQVKQADAYFAKKEYQMAASTYEDFVNSYPEDENAPYAMKQVGESYEKDLPTVDRDQTITFKAIERFTYLQNRYPASPYAADAEAHLKRLQERLAAREFYVGEFYCRTGSYNASILRLEYLLNKYPETKDREKALHYLVRDYEELERPDKVQYYWDMLAKEYPKSNRAKPVVKERKASGTQQKSGTKAGDAIVAANPSAAVAKASFSYDDRKKKDIPLIPLEPAVSEEPSVPEKKGAVDVAAAKVKKEEGPGSKASNQSSRPEAPVKSEGNPPAGDSANREQAGASEKAQAPSAAAKEKKDSLGFFTGKGPIVIDGDTGESLEKNRVLIFTGNVIAKQLDPDPAQTFYLFCNKLTAYTSEDTKEIERMEAEGNVKLVKQDKTATSKQAFYYKDKAQIVLKGDVVMFLGADKLAADTVTYYINEDRFYVQGDKEKRARATITPKKK